MLIKRNAIDFDDFFGFMRMNSDFNYRNDFYKNDYGDNVIYYRNIPGVKKENVVISFDNDVMNVKINGHKLIENYNIEYNAIIPPKLDIESAEANIEDGVLSIKFKTVNKVKTLKIK